jgi:uncharacterized protein (TIGR00730 family)
MANALTVSVPRDRSRLRELLLFGRTLRDFLTGFTRLHLTGPCVTVFGSARMQESHPYYTVARDLGRRLSAAGFTVMTGGGPGLMEAANRGAKESGGHSVACNIKLPVEQAPNRFIDRCVTCHHFFVRKVLMFRYSYGFVVLPGGFGTMDEMFEALTLIQTGKIERFPVVLVGMDYWKPLLDFMSTMAREQMIDAVDLDLLLATDDLQKAVDHVERHAVERFGLRRHPETPASSAFATRLKTRSAA